MSDEPLTLADIMAAYKSQGEHAIILLFTSTNNAAIPVCWCHTEDEAVEKRRLLLEAAKPKTPLIWFLPVSDVPRMP